MEHVAAADGEAGDEGDDDFGHRPDEALEVEDVEARDAILAHVAAFLVATDLLVAAGAEGELTVALRIGASEEYHADRGVVARIGKSLQHLGDRIRGEGVAAGGAVDRHAGDTIGLLVHDVGERSLLLPTDLGLHGVNLAGGAIFSNE